MVKSGIIKKLMTVENKKNPTSELDAELQQLISKKEVKNMSLIEKLRDFLLYFPDKSQIDFVAAKEYLEDAFGKKLEEEYVLSFLIALGYKEIIRTEEIEETEDDLDLDDIINLDWESRARKKTYAAQPYENNAYYLTRFHYFKDSKAFERLVEDNLNLVRKWAARYFRYVSHSLSYEDLVSEGIIGLIKAILKFDVDRGMQFSTYAVWWIRQQITRAIIETGTTVRIPVHMFETIMRINREELSYKLNGLVPDHEEICRKLSLTPEMYKQAKLAEHRFLTIASLDQFVSNEDHDTELGEFISPSSNNLLTDCDIQLFDPALIAERNDIRNNIIKMIEECLKPREQIIILERFGLVDDEPKTLEQLGLRFGLTRERIRQIEAKALQKLRIRMLKKAKYEDYVWTEPASGG